MANQVRDAAISAPEPASVRLFFALWPEERVKAKLAAWAARAHDLANGRLMRADNLHLTLAFLGDTPVERLDEVKSAASRVKARDFDWELDTVGYWNHNRILWVGTTRVPEPLGELVADLRAALMQANIPFDAKAFVPHITLVRNARHVASLPPWKPQTWKVNGFALVKSVRTEQGSRYVNAAQWPEAEAEG